jgi:hypothetical protein
MPKKRKDTNNKTPYPSNIITVDSLLAGAGKGPRAEFLRLLDLLESAIRKPKPSEFTWKLQRGIKVGEKRVYVVGKSKWIKENEAYLVSHLKAAVRLEKGENSLAPPNRNLVCRELLDLLTACIYPKKSKRKETKGDKYETLIIRTDIQQFYESIDRELLLRELEKLEYVSHKAVELSRKLMEEYEKVSDPSNPIGLPRGVGASTVLAGVAMIDFDKELKKRLTRLLAAPPDMYYRFVDDIIIVFHLNNRRPNKEAIRKTLREVAADFSLKVHAGEKTRVLKVKGPLEEPVTFDYLGYDFTLGKRRIILDITEKRFDKLKGRIEQCFKAYARRPSVQAADLLRKRIRLISSNFRFEHKGTSISAGINQSNPLIPVTASPKRIFALDKVYRDCVRKYVKYEDNKRVLAALGDSPFKDGFRSRRFIRMPSYEKYKNLAVWKQKEQEKQKKI